MLSVGRVASARGRWHPQLDAGVLRQVAVVLVAAALAEIVLLRLVTRVGVHLPKSGAVGDAISLASLTGSFALNLASILTTAFVAVLLGAIAWRAGNALLRPALVVLGGAMLWGLALSLATDSATADFVFGIATTALVLLIAVLVAGDHDLPAKGRLALALIAGAYVVYQYYALGHLAAEQLGYATTPPAAIPVLRFGELLVVLGAAAAFWAWGIERWRHAGRAGTALAVGPVFVVFAGSLAPASTSSILALWTTGLSLYLPISLYLIALGLYLYTIVVCWRSGDAFWVSAGLLLVLLAGYMPEASYHHLLLLLGLTFLAGGAASLIREDEAGSISLT